MRSPGMTASHAVIANIVGTLPRHQIAGGWILIGPSMDAYTLPSAFSTAD